MKNKNFSKFKEKELNFWEVSREVQITLNNHPIRN
jgi:hypothetical protein